MNIKKIDLSASGSRAEFTVSYGNNQQINVVNSHTDLRVAAAMAALEVINSIRNICETEIFQTRQKEQSKQFDELLEVLPVMIEE